MGFIIHVYIIFGTNLLTGGPTQNCYFLPILGFRRKGISNGVQTEGNLRERDFWNKRDPKDFECKSRSNRGGHEGGGRAPRTGRATLSRGPLGRPPTYFFLLYIPMYPENIRSAHKNYLHRRNLLYPRAPSLAPSPALAGGGIDHRGLLHQHHSPSDEL